MPSEVWLAAASGAAFLALALLAATRRARHPLALHLGLMSVGLFAYNLAEVLSTVAGQRFWVWVGDSAAALTAIPTFELFVGFLGGTRSTVTARRMARWYFGLLGVLGVSPLIDSRLAWLHDSGAWPLLMLAGLVPGFVLTLAAAMRRARQAGGRERVRAQLLGVALLVGVGSVLSDLAAMAGLSVPRLSYFGLLLSSLLVAALVFEAHIIEGVRVATVVSALLVAMLAVVAQIVVVAWAGGRTGAVVFGTALVAVLSGAALVPLALTMAEQRARTDHLVTLGRFARQMAHDVRNPLAAIKGAAQFLEEERKGGRSIDEQAEMLGIIVEQVDRIERFIADYQRMARLEPALRPTDPNALALTAIRAMETGGEGSFEVTRELADGLPSVDADPDLLGFALENVIRNAREAIPSGGTVTVSTEAVAEPAAYVRIGVRDNGPGMDVRTLDRALGGFFTTKEGGSGLGLAFVRRVIDAHGGRLQVRSEEGRGTFVAIDLPAKHHQPAAGASSIRTAPRG
jgi:two-component system, NtrC family, sensor histidine kinase HydH